jgi:5-carboxymethyl-2-hydroxymuconate isomerase
VKAFLAELFETRPFALSLYVQEVQGWKHNSMHRRFAKLN